MKIHEFFLKRRVGTLMLWTGLILGGIWSLFHIRTDFLPDFTVPKLTVISTYKGLPAEEIRSLITIPLEDSLSSAGGLKKIRSISRDGLAIIGLEFPWGTDPLEAGLETRSLTDLAWHNLPSDAGRPRVLAEDPGDMPILTLGVFPRSGSLSLARRLAERDLRSRLQRIEGVGSIQISGGTTDEVQVEIDQERLVSLGYSLPTVTKAVGETNIDYPAGTITEGNTEYLVKTRSRVRSLSDLGEIFLPNQQGQSSSAPTRLKDLAEIEMGIKDRSSVFISAEDSDVNEGVRLLIRRTAGFSPVSMVDNIKEELADISRSFERDLDIRILSDRSLSLEKSIRDLSLSLFSGVVFAFAVILVFMRDLPRAFLLLISIPSSLLIAVLLLFLSGRSFNLMSLGGLALGAGMAVDNSIVVTERLSRLKLYRHKQENVIMHVSLALEQLTPSLTGSTLTTIIVFLPLLFIKGLTGALFADLGLSVIFSLLSSLLMSLSFIPVLYILLNPVDINMDRKPGSLRFASFLVKTGIQHPVAVSLVTVIICAAAALPFRRLPLEVISPVNEGILRGCLALPAGTGIESVRLTAEQLAGGAAVLPGVTTVNTWAGGDLSDPYYLASNEESSERIQLEIHHRKNADTKLIAECLHAMFSSESGTLDIGLPENILAGLMGVSGKEDWVISGDNPETVRMIAEETVRDIPEAHLLPEDRKKRLIVSPDRLSLSSSGLVLSELNRQLTQAVSGSIPANIPVNGEETDIHLRLRESDRSGREDILQLNIPGTGGPVRLNTVAGIQEEQALPYLIREGRKDLSIIRLSPEAGRDTALLLSSRGAVPEDIPILVTQLPVMLTTLVMAVVLLYLCLGVQFESFTLPLLLMICIPAGGSGIIALLFLSGHSLDLTSSLGILVVTGISVNNGILLFEESSRMLKQKGALPLGALYRGAMSRLRPIMMTSLTTVSALIPLAVDPFGTSGQASLAVSVIGGLIFSSLVSLLIMPNIIKIRLKSSLR